MSALTIRDALDRIWSFQPSLRRELLSSEGLRRASRLVSNRSGIIAKVEFQRMRAGEPNVYWAHSSPPLFHRKTGWSVRNDGFGVSTDAERAAIKSIGESIERYCAVPPPESALEYGSFASLKHAKRLLRPEHFTFFSELQYSDPLMPYSKPLEDSALHWVEGVSLISGSPILVPAFLVYTPWNPSKFGYRTEARHGMPISTGLACGSTFETAIYRGLNEVVERDAFMLSWRHERALPSIERAVATRPLTKSLLKAIDGIPVTCIMKLATIDIPVNVVLVMLTAREDRFPLFAMGAGADFDFEHAVSLALEEALLCYCGLSRVELLQRYDIEVELESSINPLALFGLAHATDRTLRDMRNCLSETTKAAVGSADQSSVGNVGVLIQELARLGYEPIAVDLTQPEIDESGFKVVRVLVPGLQPLDIDAKWPYFGSRRWDDTVWKKSEIERVSLETAIRRLPHPFA